MTYNIKDMICELISPAEHTICVICNYLQENSHKEM